MSVFKERALEIGLLQTEWDRIEASAWNAYSRFAFSCHHVPGQANETNSLKMAAKVTGVGAGDPPARVGAGDPPEVVLGSLHLGSG